MRRVQQISEARAKANYQNAIKSTGPKTAAGKIVSRLNAAKHGILSGLQVLPVERQRDWEAHCEALFADLKPVGYLETSLVERIALFFWRLGRIARYEREIVSIQHESLPEEIAESRREKANADRLCADSSPIPLFGVGDDIQPDEVISRPGKAKKELALLEGFPRLPDTTELTRGQAMSLICAIESVGEVDIYEEDFPAFPGIPDNVAVDDFDRWTAGIVRGAWKIIATAADIGVEALHATAVIRACGELAGARAERKRVLTQLDRHRRLRLLPGSQDMEKIARYEGHIERGLYRALHELQRLQAARAGLIAPPLAVDMSFASSD
jgi:hypothetical protein